jgi:hypothetical protein
MKLLFLLLPTLSFSQSFHKVPEKKDNTVIVHNVTFDAAIHKMIDMGIHIDKIDKDYKTAQYKVDGNQTVYIRFDSTGNMIVTSDLFFRGNIFVQHSPIHYAKSSLHNFRWRKMMKYAEAFPDLDYAKL